jgi:hypothetical protein
MAAYTHAICKRDFDSQALLDTHVAFDWTFSSDNPIHYPNPLQVPVCRLNEGMLLIKGFNY